MAINFTQTASIFQSMLDKQILQEATSGWMEANAGQVKYCGGNEVKIPKLSMQGLGNYSRDEGFAQGSVSLSYGSYTLTQDRGRTFQIDAMDVDESNFAATAANLLGEFQRVHVIPEIDSYRYSAIYAAANAKSFVTTYTPAASDVLSKLQADIFNIYNKLGETPLVITMSMSAYNVLNQSTQLVKYLSVGSFKKGELEDKIMHFNGNPVVRVSGARMKTAYTVRDGVTAGQEAGGLAAATGAKDINWIICAAGAPLAVSKTDVVRIFDPLTNQRLNAYKIDYRKFHDLWVPDNKADGIWVNVSA
ncbi:MAG: hypothetical protein FWE85_03115 [Clostridiales bacterium]|nr:hypothetical protein [Clostridiales bacterium]